MKPSILFVVPAEYDELKEKGVESMIFERDENGFFGKVITVHPFAKHTRVIVLDEVHQVHEIGFDLIPGAARFRALKYLQAPLHFLRVVRTIVRLIKDFEIDLLRGNDPFWMGFFAYLGSRFCKVPYCVSIHADYDRRIELDKSISISTVFGSYGLAKRLERLVLSRASLVLPIRQSLAVKASQNGALSKRTRIIPHGIDLSAFNRPPTSDIRGWLEIDPSKKIVSFVGRLSLENYVDDVLKIAESLAHKREDFMLVMIGGGKEETRLKAVVAGDPVLAQCVRMVGFQSRAVCVDVRRASYASLCLMAGFSLIEACAAGRPVISYDVEWHSELVKNVETGFLLKESDVEGVVNGLVWLLDHPAESDAMGANARLLAFERHDLAKTSETKVRWYSELLNRGSAYGSTP